MTLFEQVKECVTARQATEHYGIKVKRNGMACCPFHKDRHPSMKADKIYIPHYSIIDLKNWKRIGKEDPKGVQYHIIAGRKAFSVWRMKKGKICPKKICEVKWNEINL